MASLLLLLYSKPEPTDYLQKIVNPDFSPPATDRCWGRCPSPPCLWRRPRSWEHPCEVSKTSSPAYLARAARSPSSSCSAASAWAGYPPALLERSPSLSCAYPLKRIITAKGTTNLRMECLPKKLPKPRNVSISRRIERAIRSSNWTTRFHPFRPGQEWNTEFGSNKVRKKVSLQLAIGNWLKGSGSALLCLRPLVLITGKYNWGGDN